MNYFDNLSPLTQILLVFGGLALLFLLVIANNKRNKQKRPGSNTQSFKERLEERKKEREEKDI
ncbi:hypothetical protein [Mesonia aquimarina]|uniref:hypothetical protein n=1 Tax=Mesonia aquimarina TaxID=1504967 RepID=UPI000EF603A3|nr:hypothetical protein [Mesonia aquimarina]